MADKGGNLTPKKGRPARVRRPSDQEIRKAADALEELLTPATAAPYLEEDDIADDDNNDLAGDDMQNDAPDTENDSDTVEKKLPEEEEPLEEKQKDTPQEPGKTREKLPEPQDPVREPSPTEPARPPAGAKGGEVGGTAAESGAVSEATGQAAGRAASGAARGAVKSAAEGAVKEAAGAAAKKAATKAATKLATQTAGRTAIAVVGSEAAVPIGLIILAILVIVIVIGIGVAIYQHYTSGREGSTPPIAADISNEAVAQSITNLAALAGDLNARQKLAQAEVGNLDELLTQAEKDIEGAPYEQEMREAISQARQHIETIRVGQPVSAGNTDAAATDAVELLFRSLDRLIALYHGVNITSNLDIANRAKKTVEENAANNWVFSVNENPEASEPLRDGGNTKNNKKGCDPAGFLSFVLRRDLNDPNKITFKTRVSPAYTELTKHYQYLLAAQNLDSSVELDALPVGSIILTSKTAGNKTERNLYILTGDQNGDGILEVAHCNAAAPEGPRLATTEHLAQTGHAPQQLLTYKYGQ